MLITAPMSGGQALPSTQPACGTEPSTRLRSAVSSSLLRSNCECEESCPLLCSMLTPPLPTPPPLPGRARPDASAPREGEVAREGEVVIAYRSEPPGDAVPSVLGPVYSSCFPCVQYSQYTVH